MPSKLRLIGTINLQQQQMILPLENVMNSWFSVLLLAREPIFVLNDMRSQQILSIRGGQGSPDVKTLNSNASYIMRFVRLLRCFSNTTAKVPLCFPVY